jgi:hypothetical protein
MRGDGPVHGESRIALPAVAARRRARSIRATATALLQRHLGQPLLVRQVGEAGDVGLELERDRAGRAVALLAAMVVYQAFAA